MGLLIVQASSHVVINCLNFTRGALRHAIHNLRLGSVRIRVVYVLVSVALNAIALSHFH